jgi:hypothetical protein
MSAAKLQEFIRSRSKSSSKQVNFSGRKKAWIDSITTLYQEVDKWLTPLLKDKSVRFHKTTVEIAEDHIGTYQIDILHILIGKDKVSFIPKGALVIGGNGRIDILGPRASQTLILNKEYMWEIVSRRTPKPSFIPFTEESFLDTLRQVM